jgi:hypothetical protein
LGIRYINYENNTFDNNIIKFYNQQ